MTIAQTQSDESGNLGVDFAGDRTWQYFWGMLLVASLPMLLSYLSNLWRLEAYRYFPFVLLSVGWFVYTRWDRQFRPPVGWIGWAIIGFGLLLIVFAVLIPSPWLAAVGFFFFCLAFLASSQDEHQLSLVGLALPLVMLVHLPLGFDQLLVIRLQQITTSLSSVLLDVFTVPHAIEYNIIRLTTRDLFVAEACSGIQSVFTLMFLSTLLVTANRRPLWSAPIYLVIAIMLAVFANVLRVTTVALGDVWFSIDLAEGWQHELVGYAALGFGALMLLSFDQLIIGLLHPVDSPPGQDGELNPFIRLWNFLVGAGTSDGRQVGPIVLLLSNASRRGAGVWQYVWPRKGVIVLAGILAVASVGQAIHVARPVRVFAGSTEPVFVPNPSLFDDQLADVKVLGHEITREGSDPRLGENSDVWQCHLEDLGLDAQFIVTQPYGDWHELCWCYTVMNWTMLSRVVRGIDESPLPDGDEVNSNPYILAKFKPESSGYCYLYYSAIDRSANLISPPPQVGRLQGRFAQYLYQDDAVASSDLAMLQFLVTSPKKLETQELEQLSERFVQMRGLVQKDVLGSANQGVGDPENGNHASGDQAGDDRAQPEAATEQAETTSDGA